MNKDTIIHNINKLCASNEYTTARNLMESNLTEISKPENYLKLSREGYAIYKIILTESKVKTALSRLDVYTISQINKLANNFDIAGLRTLIRNSGDILSRNEVKVALTDVAKSVLTSMGHSVVPSREVEKDTGTQFIEDLNVHNKNNTVSGGLSQERRSQATRVKLGTGSGFHSNR